MTHLFLGGDVVVDEGLSTQGALAANDADAGHRHLAGFDGGPRAVAANLGLLLQRNQRERGEGRKFGLLSGTKHQRPVSQNETGRVPCLLNTSQRSLYDGNQRIIDDINHVFTE